MEKVPPPTFENYSHWRLQQRDLQASPEVHSEIDCLSRLQYQRGDCELDSQEYHWKQVDDERHSPMLRHARAKNHVVPQSTEQLQLHGQPTVPSWKEIERC